MALICCDPGKPLGFLSVAMIVRHYSFAVPLYDDKCPPHENVPMYADLGVAGELVSGICMYPDMRQTTNFASQMCLAYGSNIGRRCTME